MDPTERPETHVVRFGKTTRWFHWSFALSFLCLAATGAGLSLRSPLGISAATGTRLLDVHKVAAICLVVLPAWVVLAGQTRELFQDLRGLLVWSRDDLRWLALQPISALRSVELPPAGKLNAGQKVNSIATIGLSAGLLGSGLWLWREPGALLPLVFHVGCFLVWIPLFAGHLALALILPGTRPALLGMAFGQVRREWAAHHHPRWLRELEAGDGPQRTE